MPFKYWPRGAGEWEFDPKPFNKTTWLVVYKKLGGITQLDMARYYAMDIEGPYLSTITNTWIIDGRVFCTDTFTLSSQNAGESMNSQENILIDGASVIARMYNDQIPFPPGARGYLFQQKIRRLPGIQSMEIQYRYRPSGCQGAFTSDPRRDPYR